MNAKWYLARPGGAAVGPLRTDVLVHRIRSGTISREALVWCQGMPKWLPLSSVTELADAVRNDPGPSLASAAPAGVAQSAAQRGEPQKAPRRDAKSGRADFEEEDADEKTELAIPGSLPAVPSSSEPTVLRAAPPAPVHPPQNTLAIVPGAAPNAYSESWAWQAANAPASAYDLPDSVTKVVNPPVGPAAHAPVQVQRTLPAAGVPATVVPGYSGSPPHAEPAPTRIGALSHPLPRAGTQALPEPVPAAPVAPAASVAAAYPAQVSPLPAQDDMLPPPYPPGFPGPDARPPLPPAPAAPVEQDPVELPMSKSTAGTRLAVAVVFILGLALGIFGARRVVMMRQSAQENHSTDSH